MIRLICDYCGKLLWESGNPTTEVMAHSESGFCVCRDCLKENTEPLPGRTAKIPPIRLEREE